ncbi:MAG: hypothetical protein EBT03_10560, partial [Betaproteobacteria bacterium]|nr:hypothetical protein [Betaproteobacteria bacterium]
MYTPAVRSPEDATTIIDQQGRIRLPAEEVATARDYLERSARYDTARGMGGIRRATHDPDALASRAPVKGGWIVHRCGVAESGPTQSPPLTGPKARAAQEGRLQEAIDHALGELFTPSAPVARLFDNARWYTDPDGFPTRLPTSRDPATGAVIRHAPQIDEDGEPIRSPLRPWEWSAALRLIRARYRRRGWTVPTTGERRRTKRLPGGYVGSAASRGDDPARIAALLDQGGLVVRKRGRYPAPTFVPFNDAEARECLALNTTDEAPGDTVRTTGGTCREPSRLAAKSGGARGFAGNPSAPVEHPPTTVRDSRPAPRPRYVRQPLPRPPSYAIRARTVSPDRPADSWNARSVDTGLAPLPENCTRYDIAQRQEQVAELAAARIDDAG